MRWDSLGRARARRTAAGQPARRAAASCSERRLCSAYQLRAGARRMKKKRNGVSLVTWLRRLSGEGFTGAASPAHSAAMSTGLTGAPYRSDRSQTRTHKIS